MSNVLFVCLQNAGRSQMSEAFFNRRAADSPHQARSAGTSPAATLHPVVVTTMAEAGIDLSERVPRGLTPELAAWADLVVTMGCGDQCPYIPGTRYLDWNLDDPAGREPEAVRAIRDEIMTRADSLLTELDR